MKPNFVLWNKYSIVDQQNKDIPPYTDMSYMGRTHQHDLYFYTFTGTYSQVTISEDSFWRYSITPDDPTTPPTGIKSPTCLNCKHWRDKSWTDKGWGICDNSKNETKISLRGMITNYLRDHPAPEKDQIIEELVSEVENGIRYPEDFGCIFFEPSNVSGS